MIDKLISSARIQTKVLVLVTPFVLSITAVGLTGFYTSGMLKGRMEISNSVVQSLRGFQEVYSSMTAFLMDPSDQTHDAAQSILSRQTNELRELIDDLHGQTGVDSLERALVDTGSIERNIATIWGLHNNRNELSQQVTAGLEALNSTQSAAAKQVFILTAAARNIEIDAKKQLKVAVHLNTLSARAKRLMTDVGGAPAAAQPQFLSATLPEIAQAVEMIEKMTGSQRLVPVEAMKAAMADLTATPVQATAMTVQIPSLSRVGEAADALKALAEAKTGEAVAELAKQEQSANIAGKVSNKLKAITAYGGQIRIAFAELAAKPDGNSVALVGKTLILYAQELSELASIVPDNLALSELPTNNQPVLKALGDTAKAIVETYVQQQAEFDAAAAQIDNTWSRLSEFSEAQKRIAGDDREQANSISAGAMFTGILIAILAGLALIITLRGPIGKITMAMRRLAEGRLDVSISGENRKDEIGDMARALSIFKENALTKVAMERDAEQTRSMAEEQRRLNEAERQESSRQVHHVVETLAASLSQLSRGDLTISIEAPFPANFEKLRVDFNASIAGLRETLSHIRTISDAIHENGQEMSMAVDDLARRTEHQAVSTEQTASAVEEISVAVRNSSDRAGEVRRIVQEAKSRAEASSGIVDSAFEAMLRIRDASARISQIVELIDGLAFQTNLLALNAGIEAARAGDSGMGFAVVAREVRELAQRSADAAKEIAGFIADSETQVADGSYHVEQTGSALIEIAAQIVDIALHIDLIAVATNEQSASIASVNELIANTDQLTQQNSAMVDEANAATTKLAGDAAMLNSLLNRFILKKPRQLKRVAS